MDDSLVYINAPITDRSDDIIGLSPYADKLQSAISSGSRMIAVTSPFGAGKSSLSKLLEENLQEHSEYKIVRLSLWPQLLAGEPDKTDRETNELHRYFLYQLVSKVKPRKAAYIGKRLNGNYGLWKIQTNSGFGSFLLIVAAILFVISFIIGKFMDADDTFFKWSTKTVSDGTLVASIVLFVISVWRSEILFSSRKSEGQRLTTPSDIIDVYKKYVLKCNEAEHYVVVIEDLDRTDNNELVVTFLKELRKYYVEDENGKVTFIVNIKPESFIHDTEAEHEKNSHEALYSKLFDYTLNLQSINIMDYDAILDSLICQKEELIKSLLDIESVSLRDIPEMEWIIRGEEISIRTIKDRLNKAFSLYESIKIKFPESPSDFKKCTASAYLTTEYEKDFYATDHEAFGYLVEAYIQGELKEQLDTLLPKGSPEYKDAVKELIEARLIDDEYHRYYYNYPQFGHIYYSDELVVKTAILYGTPSENLSQMIERSLERNSTVFEESFDRIKRLGIKIPELVFEKEMLYIEALRYYPEGVYTWMSNLDYSNDAKEPTIEKILSTLAFDVPRSIYGETHAKKYIDIWKKRFQASALLNFREHLCKSFPAEIGWYKELFMHPYTIISENEIQCIDISDAILLADAGGDNLSNKTIVSIIEKLKVCWPRENVKDEIEGLLLKASKMTPPAATAEEVLNYMELTISMPEALEKTVVEAAKRDDNTFQRYQTVIGKIDASLLSDQTLENIYELDKYNGYSISVCNRLYGEGYIYDATLISITEGYPVNFGESAVAQALESDVEHLIAHIDLFFHIRMSIIKSRPSVLEQYHFLFTSSCPVVNKDELYALAELLDGVDSHVLKLIPDELITTDVTDYLMPFLNRCWHSNGEAFAIIKHIARWAPTVAYSAFYSLDFNRGYKYMTFSDSRRNAVREAFRGILNLDNINEQIKYMKATMWIDSKFDGAISNHIIRNGALAKEYIEAVNVADPKSITNNTITNVTKIPNIYAMNEAFCNRLFKAGEYERYIISTTLRIGEFKMASGEELELLWPTYVEIYTSGKYNSIKEYMLQNMAFLDEIISRGSYHGMPDSARKELSKVDQSADSIMNIIEYGNSFAIDYLATTNGFIDRNAAVACLDLIEENPVLLAADGPYNNIHDKLVDPKLKGRYTRMRNKVKK